uniref:Uncharacterized protein n=1 Tax=Fagus sylvatica TaxID=28930 RepID=A0A2N9FGD2_FAGSY
MGSSDSKKAYKPSSLNTISHSAGNKLSRSVSSLPEPKKENIIVPSDAKASMAQIRRLSEPKMGSSHHVSSVKSQSAEPVSKRKISDGPESKKLSAIVNYDKSKAATLPELKIRTSKGPDVARTKSAAKEMTQKVNGKKSSTTSEGAELKRNNENTSHHNDGDDNPAGDWRGGAGEWCGGGELMNGRRKKEGNPAVTDTLSKKSVSNDTTQEKDGERESKGLWLRGCKMKARQGLSSWRHWCYGWYLFASK